MPATILLSFLLVFATSGCLSLRFGGGGRKTTTENRTESTNVTLGQQLVDLQKAYDSGIITERQYNAQKKKLLKGK
jgi:hypothetical protein